MRIGHTPYGQEEIEAAIRVLRSGMMSYGPETAAFEREFADWLGVPYAVMVNSGSSANLLAFEALKLEGVISPGDEIVVPAVAWSTSLFPIAQVGCVPVLVDVSESTLNLDSRRQIKDERAHVMSVHLLGNPAAIMHPLVEDCCEAHGAAIGNRKVGTRARYSTFSFFFAHHITCIEGGMVCCKHPEQRDLLLSLRSHGWVRERSDREEWAEQYPDIDPRWLFVTPGYNLRPTDVQAAFAREQLKKLDGFVEKRIEIRHKMLDMLMPYADHFDFQKTLPGHTHSGFGFALICKRVKRDELRAHLEANGIETRPIVAGNLARQPALAHIIHRVQGRLENADRVHHHGLMLASHQNVTDEDIQRLAHTVDEFLGATSILEADAN